MLGICFSFGDGERERREERGGKREAHHAGDHAFILLAHGDTVEVLCEGDDFGAFVGGGHFDCAWVGWWMLVLVL